MSAALMEGLIGMAAKTTPFAAPGPVVRGVSPPISNAPLREPTEVEAAEWAANGVVCLRQVIPPEWTEYLRACLDDIFERDSVSSKGLRTDMTQAAAAQARLGAEVLLDGGAALGESGSFLTEIDCWWHEGLRHFELSSPLPQVVAAALSSDRLRFYQDHLFKKEAGANIRTGFHQDRPYFCWAGEQIAVCWCSPTAVTAEMGTMCYVKGSHRWAEHKPTLLVSNTPTHDHPGPALPDIDGNPADYEVLTFETQPGDIIIHHANTVHGSRGNTDPR